MKRKALLFFNKILIAFTLLAYGCAFISPETFWLAGFVAYLIPVFFLFHFFCLYAWWKLDKKKMLLSALTLLIGYKFIFSTVAINFDNTSKSDFSVLSYNTRVFNVYDHLNEGNHSSEKMLDWVKNDDSDIKCFQEYYNLTSSETFNSTQKIKNGGQYYAYVQPRLVSKKQEFGLAIFSKFPIIKKGRIEFSEASSNDAIFADVVIEKKDTIRIINIHLQSMSIDEKNLTNTDEWKSNAKSLGKSLKRGFIARAKQLDAVEKYVLESPHRVVLCGDLNDTPYSYTYFRLLQTLRSTFEHAGNGFGFSYNGKLFFLRIDNQFHSKDLFPSNYETLRSVKFSDHFPIKGFYRFEE